MNTLEIDNTLDSVWIQTLPGYEDERTVIKRLLKKKVSEVGGPGSGNYGHEGRPGLIGGSAPGKVIHSNFDLNTYWRDQEAVTLYHGTSLEHYQEVEQEGLSPQTSGKIYFTTSPEQASWYAQTGGEEDEDEYYHRTGQVKPHIPIEERVILEVKIPPSMLSLNGAPLFQTKEVWESHKELILNSFRDDPQKLMLEFTTRSIIPKEMIHRVYHLEPEMVFEVGGPGSGNFGHAGIPGHQGGSAPSKEEWDVEQHAQDWGQYQTVDGHTVEGVSSTTDYRDLSLEDLRKLDPDTKVSVKLYSARRGGVNRREMLVKNLVLWNKEPANDLLDALRPDLIRGIIPLDDYHSSEWIQYGLMTPEFRDYFREHPNGDTEKWNWDTRKVDTLWNLHVRKKIQEMGTSSSGNYGHEGRPGLIGGSAPSEGITINWAREPREIPGLMPVQMGEEYFYRPTKMSPEEYLAMTPSMYHKEGTLEFLTDRMKRGEPTAPPVLFVLWDNDDKVWRVDQHEGRHRATAALMLGAKEIPVDLVFERGYRARDVTDEMMKAPIIPQSEWAEWRRTHEDEPLFEFHAGEDLEDIKAEYQRTLTSTMRDYLYSDRPLTSFRNAFRRCVNDGFTLSFYDGWADAGGGPIPDDAITWLVTKIDNEVGYADSLFRELKYQKKNLKPEEIMPWIKDRAEGYTKTLNGIYDEAKVRAVGRKMLTFGGVDGKESCKTCQRLKGQRHTARWWVTHGLIPGQSGNPNYICLGYNCQHVLLDDNGAVFTTEMATQVAMELWLEEVLGEVGTSRSGYHGHAGRPGKIGGSTPSGEAVFPGAKTSHDDLKIEKGFGGGNRTYLVTPEGEFLDANDFRGKNYGSHVGLWVANQDVREKWGDFNEFLKKGGFRVRETYLYTSVQSDRVDTSTLKKLQGLILDGKIKVNNEIDWGCDEPFPGLRITAPVDEFLVMNKVRRFPDGMVELTEVGTSKSGYHGHSGRPGKIGGSAPDEFPLVNDIDDLQSMDVGSNTSVYGYFILPNHQLLDLQSKADDESEHYTFMLDHPDAFGVKGSEKLDASEIISQIFAGGTIRVRFVVTGDEAIVAIQTSRVDTSTLRKLQDFYYDNRLFQADSISWEGENGDLETTWDEFISGSKIRSLGGKLEISEVGGPGSGHHGHKGVPGHRGGSAPSGEASFSIPVSNPKNIDAAYSLAKYILKHEPGDPVPADAQKYSDEDQSKDMGPTETNGEWALRVLSSKHIQDLVANSQGVLTEKDLGILWGLREENPEWFLFNTPIKIDLMDSSVLSNPLQDQEWFPTGTIIPEGLRAMILGKWDMGPDGITISIARDAEKYGESKRGSFYHEIGHLLPKYIVQKHTGPQGPFETDGDYVDRFSKVLAGEVGGPGSGHHGHQGVKGHRGGSAPSGAPHTLDYGKELEAARKAKDKSVYGGYKEEDSFETRWLKEHFDIPYELNTWGQYNDEYTSIRNSWVVDDDRTLKLNSSLRKGNPPTKWAERIDTLCDSKFKQDSLVFRGAALSQDIINRILEAGGFTDLGFMSTSGEKNMSDLYLDSRLDQFPGAIPVMFHLKVPKGSRIGIMDAGELTFPRGTKVHIINWTHNELNDLYEINGEVETP